MFRCIVSKQTIFDESKQFCDWSTNSDCVEASCPPTREPSTGQPTMPIDSCPNPCPIGYTGFSTRPSSACKQYVSCKNGEVVDELECFGDTIFNESAGYCDWPSSYTCDVVICPEREPTVSPTAMEIPDSPDSGSSIDESADCPNPCPVGFDGSQTRPGTQCKKYVSCVSGEVKEEKECFGDTVFNPNVQYCDWASTYRCRATECPERELTVSPTPRLSMGNPTLPPADFPTQQPAIIADKPPSVVETARPIKQPTQRPTRQPTMLLTMTPTPRPSFQPTTAKPNPTPVPTYQHFRTILIEREDAIKSFVLQSNGKPSSAYTFPDLLSSLDIAVFQFPTDKAFFFGEGMSGGFSGVEYG